MEDEANNGKLRTASIMRVREAISAERNRYHASVPSLYYHSVWELCGAAATCSESSVQRPCKGARNGAVDRRQGQLKHD